MTVFKCPVAIVLLAVVVLTAAPAGSQLIRVSDGPGPAGVIAHFDPVTASWVVDRPATSIPPGGSVLITAEASIGAGTTVELWGTDFANFKYSSAVVAAGGPCGGAAVKCVQYIISCDPTTFHLWGSSGTDNEQSDYLELLSNPGPNQAWRPLGRWDCDKVATGNATTEGGLSLVSPWGDELHIPPGAVAMDTEVGIANSFPVSDPWAVPPGLFPITEAIVLSPTGLMLEEPATVIIRYSDGEIRGADEATVRAYSFDTSLREWHSIPGAVIDTDSNKITLTVTSFGEFGFTGTSTEGTVGGCCSSVNPCAHLTENDCLTLGGAYLGETIDCEAVECPASQNQCPTSDTWTTWGHDAQRSSRSGIAVGDPSAVALAWKDSLPALSSFTNPTIAVDAVYTSYDSGLRANDLWTGSLLGDFSGAPEMGSSNRGNTTVAYVSGLGRNIVFATGGSFNSITALETNLDTSPVVWSRNSTSPPALVAQNRYNTCLVETISGVDVVFVATEGTSAAGTGRLYALIAATGALYGGWATNPVLLDRGVKHSPAFDGTNLYVGTTYASRDSVGSIYSISAATGSVNWVYQDGIHGWPGGVSIEGDFLYAASSSGGAGVGKRTKIDISDTSPVVVWNLSQGPTTNAAPTISDTYLYIPQDSPASGVLKINKLSGALVHDFSTNGVGSVPQNVTLTCDGYLFAGDRSNKWWLLNTDTQMAEWSITLSGIVNGTALARDSGSSTDYAIVSVRESSTAGRGELRAYSLTPIGACCNGAGGCAQISQADCLLQSGSYHGDWSNCSSSDYDSDGIGDACDNCTAVSNPNQEDFNSNDIGDLCELGYTPQGSSVMVPVDATLSVTFGSVSSPGFTIVAKSNTGPPPPPAFTQYAPGPPLYNDIQTDAAFLPPVDVFFDIRPYSLEAGDRILHYKDGIWEDVTVLVDTANDVISGQVSTLSPFIIGKPPCACDCHADPICDAVFSNVQDVVATINVAFRGAPALIDPNSSCPYEQSDVNCDTFTSVVDVVKVVNVAFRGSNQAAEYCNPCAATAAGK